MNHESHESTQNLGASATLREALLLVGWGLLCACLVALGGCGTPRGYDDDLTPDDNGEQYIGGAALQSRPSETTTNRTNPHQSGFVSVREIRGSSVACDGGRR